MAVTQSIITITDKSKPYPNPRIYSNLHYPRTNGQGYTTVEEVIDHISDKKSAALEDYIDALEGGATQEEALDLLDARQKAYLGKIRRWIKKWSNYIDDRIRSKYSVPFPDAPYAPETLNVAATYYVVHALATYEGGHIGNRDESGEPTYYDYAERQIKRIIDNELHLETEYTLPVKDETGTIIGREVISIAIGGATLMRHTTDNPMSMGNQEREFGIPVESRFGGSGYRQDGSSRLRGRDSGGRSDDYQ